MEERTLESTLLHVLRTRLLRDYPAQIRECLTVLSNEQIWWRPNEKSNSIGNLLLHIAGSTRNYVVHAIGNRESSRDRDQEFASRENLSRDDLMQMLDHLLEDMRNILDPMEPAQLAETTDRTGKPSTFAQILLHVAQHVSAHTGQIVYVTKMLQEGSLNELWMRTRG